MCSQGSGSWAVTTYHCSFQSPGTGDSESIDIDLWARSFPWKQRGELAVFSIHCIIHIIDFAVDTDTTLAPTRTEAGSNEA